ncbi:predicted protein [Nematostella vectensis]|uniref:Uncharacterized protein n=1 Tax=Nematostella vectensis TaxID=45351 RepID=A7SL22_NEMVE|nr:predicted protein [Nematostella vectensis]|eukprot:XP_001627667.1 predicted protein [Nematostella vectensis]
MAEPEKCIKNKSPRKSRLKIQAHTSGVNRLDWNPVYTNLLASCSMDNSVRVWDTYLNGICVKSHTFHGGAVKDVKWSPGGMQLLSCGYDKSSRLIDIHTAGCQVSLFHQNDYVTCVQYHPIDRNVFLTGGARNGIKSWDIRTGNVITEYHAAFGQVQALAFLPNGQEFFSAAEVIRRNSTDKGIMAWDFISTAILSNQIYQEAFTCTSLKVHPSGCQFIAQSNGNYLAIFSTKRPYKLNKYKRYEGHKVSAYWIGCDFSPDGTLVLSASADGSVYVYNEQSSRLVTSLPGHSGVCMDVSFHPTLPSTVASCGVDGSIIIWT